jgi:hypothetical protein
MAILHSVFSRAQEDRFAKTVGYPTTSGQQREIQVARDSYTTVGTEANNDTIQLGVFIPAGARINVELSKVRFSGGGSFSASLTLRRLRAGSSTALSAALATTSAAVGTFAAASIAPPDNWQDGDILEFLVSPFTSATAGKVLSFEIVFDVPNIG